MKVHAGKLLYLVGMCLLLCSMAVGQDRIYQLHRLTTADNLTSQIFNYYIKKDRFGFVWISSTDGLNRYDGRDVIQYLPDPIDPYSIANPNITSNFFEGTSGDFWFSTVNAIHRYDQKNDRFEFRQIRQDTGVYEEQYYLLYYDSLKQNLWLRIEDTLLIQSVALPNAQPIFRAEYEMNIFSKVIRLENERGFLLFNPLEKGIEIHRFHEEQEIEKPGFYLPDLQVFSARNIGDDNYWMGTNQGLVNLDLNTGAFKIYNKFQGTVIDLIADIEKLDEQTLMVATPKKGIYFFDLESSKFTDQLYAHQEAGFIPFVKEIDRIYLDREGCLWISTYGQGLYFLNFRKKRFSTALQSFADNSAVATNVRSFSEDRQNRIWCLTHKGVLLVDSTGHPVPYNLPDSGDAFMETPLYSIFCDRLDRIWMASQSGLFVLTASGKTFKKIESFEPQISTYPHFRRITQLKDSTVLVSSDVGIFKVLDRNDKIALRRLEYLQDPRQAFTWMHESYGQEIVILRRMENSFFVYRSKNDSLILQAKVPFKPFLNGMVEDTARKKIWLISNEGLYHMLTEKPYKIEKDTALSLQTLNGGELDNQTGELWLSTNRGIIRYDPDLASWQIYGVADGVQSDEFNFWAAGKTESGRMIFGGINGMNIFRPEAIRKLGLEIRPRITQILINDAIPKESLRCDSTGSSNLIHIRKLIRSYKENTISFRFTALDFSDPGSNNFRYRMKPIDEDWVFTGTQNSARYADLPPGSYTFELQATDSDNVWSPEITKLHLKITPPWWRTWWAQMIWIFLLAVGFFFLYELRIRTIKNKEERLRKEAQFRQREAEFQQQVAEIETAVLRLQMNPHFLFNALQSINSYILKRDADKAGFLLEQFARLMRKILEYSEEKLIALSEEIELLELYLETEAMRFTQKFEYHFHNESDLDLDEYLLPPMILQPFVENAILHGLINRKQQGRIDIHFSLQEHSLLCQIQDNGIGRKMALKPSGPDKRSKAIEITKKRLALLPTTVAFKPYLKIIDLTDEAGQTSGTRVDICLPIL